MAIKEILIWLIDRHWRDLNIRPEHSHAAADLSERTVELNGRQVKLSARTLRNMLHGYVAKPNRHTCEILAELFRPHIPALSWGWFHAPTDVFKELVLTGGARGGGTSAPEDASGNQSWDEGHDALEGTYLAYRHAFSANTINRIAREVLCIYRDKGGLAFRMSYLPGTRGRSDVVMEFRGNVEVAGNAIVLFGPSAGGERRFRTLVARHNGHIEQPELENYKLGILISTREGDGVPCAACTLLVKVQRAMRDEADLAAFMRATTRTDTFDKIIGHDFVQQDWVLLRLFLGNRPTRSPKDLNDPTDAALDKWEGPGPRDPVLRISQDRFERSMEEVFQRALAATEIVPAFRGDWRPGSDDESGTDQEEA